MFYLIFLYFAYPIWILIECLALLFSGRRWVNPGIMKVVEILAIAIFPYLFLTIMDTGDKNDCCNQDTFFSPQHRLTIYAIVFSCAAAYFYSSYRKNIAPPLAEIAINCLLLAGIILNVFITLQSKGDEWLTLIGTGSVIVLFILMLIKNQQLLIAYLEQQTPAPKNIVTRICWKILGLHPAIKTPLFILLCLPLLAIITGILLLFGQKPDSLIRAFTDTYHQGFSQLDHECDNVQCGGHYLCSVAANGHKNVVKPQRLGERNGHIIICNRQLLVSNAFEELMQEKLPFLHKPIRRAYNKVGNFVHRYYGVFNNKYVADIIYLLMKPLEWFFVLVLYTFDRRPENRIAAQYLGMHDWKSLKNASK